MPCRLILIFIMKGTFFKRRCHYRSLPVSVALLDFNLSAVKASLPQVGRCSLGREVVDWVTSLSEGPRFCKRGRDLVLFSTYEHKSFRRLDCTGENATYTAKILPATVVVSYL